MSLRVGIIGLGSVGTIHLSALQGGGAYTIVAAADVSSERLSALASQYSFKPYTDIRAMLATEKLDVAVVATPAASHEAITLACAEHGAHVLCEKPLTLSLEAADRMIANCDKAGVQLGYGSTYRHLAPIETAREIIQNGEIGDVVLMHETYVSGYGPEAYVPMSSTHYPAGGMGGGGMGLVDHGIHMLDIFPWLIQDEIVSISGRGDISGDAPDTEYAIMRMSRGALGMLVYNQATWSTRLPAEGAFSLGGAWDKDGYKAPGAWSGEPGCINVHGTKGALRIYHYAHYLYKFTEKSAEQVPLIGRPAPAHFSRQMHSFASAIANKQIFEPSGKAGRTSLQWLLKVYEEA